MLQHLAGVVCLAAKAKVPGDDRPVEDIYHRQLIEESTDVYKRQVLLLIFTWIYLRVTWGVEEVAE